MTSFEQTSAKRRTKKSSALRPLTIGLIGLSAFTLAACKEEAVEATVWQNPASCAASGEATLAECNAALEQAKVEHEATAPRYDAQAVCEAQHGAGNCVSEQTSSGGSIFMPLLMGYMMGKMMGGIGGGAAAASKPLYPSANGQMTTADGSTKFNAGQGKVNVPQKAFASSPTTIGKAPMSSTQVRSTGGFGASGSGAGGSSLGG